MARKPQTTQPEAPVESGAGDEARHCAALNAYGSYLYGQGRWEEARDVFAKARKVLPDDASTCKNLATALSACGDSDEAVRLFAELSARLPGDAALHNSFGLALYRAGRLDEAAEEFSRATELAPAEYMYWHHKGTNALAQGRTSAAIAALARAVALPGASPACYYNLAVAMGQTGETERATMFLQKAVSLRMDDADLLLRAASLMKGWGRQVAAMECLRSFVQSGRHNRRVEDLLAELSTET
ncbi:MAG: tetratricopeptide repeat protein [Candidatus Cryosericum sp.]